MGGMRMGRRAGGAVLGVALLAGTAACTSASSNTSNASSTSPAAAQSTPTAVDTANIVPKHSTLQWHSCPSQGDGVECTMLSVPLNYQDPGGRQIQLALSMVPATAPEPYRVPCGPRSTSTRCTSVMVKLTKSGTSST